MSTPPSTTRPLVSACQCIAVRCSRCDQPYVDDESDAPGCFETVAEALQVLTAAGWDVDDEHLACPECTGGPSTGVTLAICEYCSPPLFSDGDVPDRCCCQQRPVVHTFVPVVSAHHPAVTVRTCFAINCSDCDEPLEIEGAPVHFTSADDALSAARGADWMVVAALEVLLCPECVQQRACAALGHTWPDEPDAVIDGTELRYCRRECGEQRLRDINDQEAP